jgi:hypothetical protein
MDSLYHAPVWNEVGTLVVCPNSGKPFQQWRLCLTILKYLPQMAIQNYGLVEMSATSM